MQFEYFKFAILSYRAQYMAIIGHNIHFDASYLRIKYFCESKIVVTKSNQIKLILLILRKIVIFAPLKFYFLC